MLLFAAIIDTQVHYYVYNNTNTKHFIQCCPFTWTENFDFWKHICYLYMIYSPVIFFLYRWSNIKHY